MVKYKLNYLTNHVPKDIIVKISSVEYYIYILYYLFDKEEHHELIGLVITHAMGMSFITTMWVV